MTRIKREMNESDDQPLSSEPFTDWKSDVDRAMLADYGINTVDAGIDDDRLRQHWMEERSPKDFVEWFATKYDLTPTSDWGWYPPKSIP
jgi:hypothetical protein